MEKVEVLQPLNHAYIDDIFHLSLYCIILLMACPALVHVDRCFYVGDAAGRAKDHSDADLKFAQVLLVILFSH